MNRIESLIAELCPDGVEYKPLGELLKYEQPTKYLVASNKYDDSYPTPVLTAGQTFILGYSDETTGVYPSSIDQPVIIFDDFTTANKWVDFSFKAKSSAMKILTAYEDVNLRYVWFAIQTIRYTPQNHARQWIGTYSNFKIPYPPLRVQEEIVKILDEFQALEAELEAELEARKKQYEYYRDQLLSFPASGGSVRWTTLSEVGTFSRGGGLQKKDFTDEGVGCIHYGQIYTHYGVWATETITSTTSEIFNKAKKANYGDVIIADTSENDEDLCKAVAWLGSEDVAVSNHTLIYTSELDPKYVSYFLSSASFQDQKRRWIFGTKVRSISGTNMGRIKIPVPPMRVQEEIVDILDKFDALTNDLTAGLPAEIEARRKQYEYYRDQLLTFKELSA